MRRREFITLFGSAATFSVAAHAQQPSGRIYRVGYLSSSPREQALHFIEAFEQGLRSLGYRVGENVAMESRFANNEMERLPALAADLVRSGVDIIVTGYNPVTIAAMKTTTTVPIVTTGCIDPVDTGIVASLARPGGNVTGLAVDAGGEILGKRFELLKETVPNLSRLGILWNPDVAVNRSRQMSIMETARALALTLVPVEANGLDALPQAFAIMMREGVQALAVQGDSVLSSYRRQIAEMAIRNGLGAASVQKQQAQAGFLLTYGADISDLNRRAASFVDKISKGAKPADLPLEQPTMFELVVNLKTAKALGLTVPPSVIARADELIE